jgi:hypothetical protein
MNTMHHFTHCALRLGDNLAHLHFLRSLAKANPRHHFVHFAHLCYIAQLSEVVCDLSNVQVMSLERVSAAPKTPQEFWSMKPLHVESIDAWKNAGGYWERHALRLDYAQFYLGHCAMLADAMGLISPMRAVQDIPFDYPALLSWKYEAFDFLVVNSTPKSGQLPAYNVTEMNDLVGKLSNKYKVITTAPTPHACGCTQEHGMTVSQIGALSCFCKYVVAVSTGPSWTTFNKFNAHSMALRVVLIDKEEVKISPRTVNVNNVSAARHELQIAGLL